MSDESLSQEASQEEISQESIDSQEHSEEIASQDQEAQLQDAVETALANGASKQEVKNLIKEFQLKVNFENYYEHL